MAMLFMRLGVVGLRGGLGEQPFEVELKRGNPALGLGDLAGVLPGELARKGLGQGLIDFDLFLSWNLIDVRNGEIDEHL